MTAISPHAAYSLLASNYDEAPNPLLALERRTVVPFLPDVQGRTVLDAAAGTGYWAAYCTAQGASAVAVDFCAEMLVRAPRPAVLADVVKLPLRDGWADLVICAFGLGYAPGCLPELARATRKGGVVIVSDMHPDAIRRGWTRSFRHRGDVVEVAHHPYALADLKANGLVLDALVEPHFGAPEREIFARAGKSAEFENAALGPAIFAARLVRQW